MYATTIIIFLFGLGMIAAGVYVYVLGKRDIVFFDLRIVDLIIANATLQTSASVFGFIGAYRSTQIHSTRGRNFWLLVFTTGMVVVLVIQVVLSALIFQEYSCYSSQLNEKIDPTKRCCTKADRTAIFGIMKHAEPFLKEEAQDNCFGYFNNGTIAWVGPVEFSRVLGPMYPTMESFMAKEDCHFDLKLFNASSYRPEYIKAYNARGGAAVQELEKLPPGCKSEQQLFDRLAALNIVELLLCFVFFLGLMAGTCLCTCKFSGVTVEGFKEDGTPFPNIALA